MLAELLGLLALGPRYRFANHFETDGGGGGDVSGGDGGGGRRFYKVNSFTVCTHCSSKLCPVHGLFLYGCLHFAVSISSGCSFGPRAFVGYLTCSIKPLL